MQNGLCWVHETAVPEELLCLTTEQKKQCVEVAYTWGLICGVGKWANTSLYRGLEVSRSVVGYSQPESCVPRTMEDVYRLHFHYCYLCIRNSKYFFQCLQLFKKIFYDITFWAAFIAFFLLNFNCSSFWHFAQEINEIFCLTKLIIDTKLHWILAVGNTILIRYQVVWESVSLVSSTIPILDKCQILYKFS